MKPRKLMRAAKGNLATAAVSAAILIVALAAMAQSKGTPDMNPRVEEQAAFTMIGIAARTSNAKEMTADGSIGKLWTRLMQENLLESIPNRADGNIVAAYTDYASDKDGEYTFVLGARVSNGDKVPTGMTAKTVPAGKYAVFTSERGPAQQVVIATWMRIWKTPKDAPGGNRAYKTDFEVYDQRAQNPADTVMEIHVGIR
jgi:predicted transcriptional regulator YdeE